MLRGVGERPVLAVLVGAVAIAFSGILFRLAHVSPSTGAFYRCVFALPPLWLLARLETRRFGRQRRRAVLLAWLAGAFFAADLILWHNAIDQVGAGLATVLGNTQVVLVAVLAADAGQAPHRDLAPATAGSRDLDSPHLAAGLLRRLRGADRRRVPLALAAGGRGLHPRRARHGHRPPPRGADRGA